MDGLIQVVNGIMCLIQMRVDNQIDCESGQKKHVPMNTTVRLYLQELEIKRHWFCIYMLEHGIIGKPNLPRV